MKLQGRAKEIFECLKALTPPPISEIERKVLGMYAATIDVGGVKLVGLTTVEVSQLLPDEDKASIRWAIWNLRKKGYLRDAGVARSLAKGRKPIPAFVKVNDV